MKKYVLFLLFIFLVTVVAAAATTPSQPAPQNKKDDQEKIDDDAMKLFLNKIEIYGKIAKPQTVFIIPGSDPRVDGLRIERRFFNDIFRTVEESTLRKQKIKVQRSKDHILW